MKRLHRKDLYTWSAYHPPLHIDFNGFAWIREGGNVLIDPLPLSEHDLAHLQKLGGAAWIVITNSNHVRGAKDIASLLGAKIAAPAAEKEGFPLPCACDRWLKDGDELVSGLRTAELEGSKTPGELALVLEDTTLFTGDLVRAHRPGALMLLLSEQGLVDRGKALASVARLLEHHPRIETVLVGDGWHMFQEGRKHLEALLRPA